MIRAIKSQLNLKPHFYAESARVGGFGCILGGVLAFYLFQYISSFFGIATDIPIRQYDQTIVMFMFASCLLTLIFCLYIFCVLSAFIYYGIKCQKGLISKDEFINIAFKGIYPKRWQKGYRENA
ncbi:hypothetical protein AGRI_01795 [Alishewanella agri BL06]|uniref:Uncharacterized protein n=2 Tax=Alishewanella TaxID=111142 RepID=I9P6A2_9ALTE|nr:hypothetical protein AJE_17100 [Alishewanella jeotgali KCTC 22429]EIW90562.1 hypothetical protein AGRI_01795 [Alishewanella agri BL06]